MGIEKEVGWRANIEPISLREKEVLELLAEGLSTKHIAERLFVSKDTVESHRKNILRKMNAKNSIQAVAHAMRNNIIK